MSDEEKVEKIGSISKTQGTKKVVDPQDFAENRIAPNKEKFDASMRVDADIQTAKIDPTKNTSLIDEIRTLNRKVDEASKVQPVQLAEQSKDVIAQIEELKYRLTDPSVEIKSDYKHILRNKLEHIDGSLRVALDKAGLEYIPPEAMEQSGNTPVERFLNLLTSGQDQMKTLGGEIQKIADEKSTISPANLLMVQMKVNYIQQEIELFTSLLNKALEGVKTIMNVQV